jgi:hypothetical protein
MLNQFPVSSFMMTLRWSADSARLDDDLMAGNVIHPANETSQG